ncbi:MAG: DUF3362 domain-containing protein, partial [Lachnospiraceae bacterium]|nr:DUF3362 domain-containing protein [Lachnospiraceae bacterium]
KVAPEHVSDNVLRYMGKPRCSVYERFLKRYYQICREEGKDQYVIPYLMSSHPGCTVKDAIELTEYLHKTGFTPEQVQDFYPTPSTLSTCMYYTEKDPFTGEHIYVAKTQEEKKVQRALMQYRDPKNRKLVTETLIKEGREDLVKKLYGTAGRNRLKTAETGSKSRPADARRKKKTIRNIHRKKDGS